MSTRGATLALLLAGLGPAALPAAEPAPARATPAKPPAAAPRPSPAAAASEAEVDMEFLEFLGSLDVEEKEWREYLEERPISKPAAKPEGQKVKPK